MRRLLWQWRRLLLLATLLLLLFLGEVMADYAAGRCSDHGMMTSHMSRHGAHGCSLQTTLGLRAASDSPARENRHQHLLYDGVHGHTPGDFFRALIYTRGDSVRQCSRGSLR